MKRSSHWFLPVLILLTSCAPGELLGPTITPLPTSTSTITPTLTPTITPTPTTTPFSIPTLTATSSHPPYFDGMADRNDPNIPVIEPSQIDSLLAYFDTLPPKIKPNAPQVAVMNI